jgi:hypothetical protein
MTVDISSSDIFFTVMGGTKRSEEEMIGTKHPLLKHLRFLTASDNLAKLAEDETCLSVAKLAADDSRAIRRRPLCDWFTLKLPALF